MARCDRLARKLCALLTILSILLTGSPTAPVSATRAAQPLAPQIQVVAQVDANPTPTPTYDAQ